MTEGVLPTSSALSTNIRGLLALIWDIFWPPLWRRPGVRKVDRKEDIANLHNKAISGECNCVISWKQSFRVQQTCLPSPRGAGCTSALWVEDRTSLPDPSSFKQITQVGHAFPWVQ